MPKHDKDLLSRDAKRNIGRELFRAIREVKAGKGIKYQVATNPSGRSKDKHHKKRSSSKLQKGVKGT